MVQLGGITSYQTELYIFSYFVFDTMSAFFFKYRQARKLVRYI